jgi:hypothetical protein
MARTNLVVTALGLDAGTAAPAATNIVQAEGAEVRVAGDTGKLFIEVINTNASDRVLTIKAPTDNPHAPRAPLGDLAVTCAQNVARIVVIESARFAQKDGKILLDFAASFAGTMRAYRLPKGS